MKPPHVILVVPLLFVAIYLIGYQILIRDGHITDLSQDPFASSKVQYWIRWAFQPINELDLRANHDRPMRKYLIGHWTSTTSPDYVRIDSNNDCEFQLGHFTYKGQVKFERAYSGFSVEFTHEGKEHIFIIGYDDGGIVSAGDGVHAIASVSHDVGPSTRWGDYLVVLSKTPEATNNGETTENPNTE